MDNAGAIQLPDNIKKSTGAYASMLSLIAIIVYHRKFSLINYKKVTNHTKHNNLVTTDTN